MTNSNSEVTLNDLLASGDLSMRSVNACYDFGLLNLELILIYFNKFGSFLGLNRCGNISNNELVKLCHQNQHQLPHDQTKLVAGNTKRSLFRTRSDNVLLKSNIDWQELVLEAMRSMSDPCSMKEISFKIFTIHKLLLISTIYKQTKHFLNLLMENNQVGLTSDTNGKYYLK